MHKMPTHPGTEMLAERLRKMFGRDVARISKPVDRMFLILGTIRNTRKDGPRWYRNNKRINFDFISEECVASGNTEDELIQSAEEYKRLLDAPTKEDAWNEYFRQTGVDHRFKPGELTGKVSEVRG